MLVAALVLALTACSTAGPPTEDPSIRGVVSTVDLNAGGTGSILVEGALEDDTSYDRASVGITSSTRVFADDGTRAQAGDIAVGSRVEVWFTGPVAESYPVQATASDVRILGGDVP